MLNLRGLVNTVKNNLNDWKSVITNQTLRKNFMDTVIKPTVSQVIKTPNKVINASINVAKMTANPYGRKQISDFVRQKTSPNIEFNKDQVYNKEQFKQFSDLPKEKQNFINLQDLMLDLTNPIVKSATPNNFDKKPFLQPPKPEFQGNILRSKEIGKDKYTPQAEQYIKSINTIVRPEDKSNWSAGGAWMQPKFIEVAPDAINQPGLEGHELMHHLDNVAKTYKPEEFLASVKRASIDNPDKMASINAFIQDYQKNQPQYFAGNENGRIASELFAQIGAVLGQRVLQDPSLAKYYKGIFKETPNINTGWIVPGPTPQNPNAPIAPIQTNNVRVQTNPSGSGSGVSVGTFKKTKQKVNAPLKIKQKIILRKVKK